MGYLTPTKLVEISEGPNHLRMIHEPKFRMYFATLEILNMVLCARPDFIETVRQIWQNSTTRKEPVWIRIKEGEKTLIDRIVDIGLAFLILPDEWTLENIPENVMRSDTLFDTQTTTLIDRYRDGTFEFHVCGQINIGSVFGARALIPSRDRHKRRWDRLFVRDVYNFSSSHFCPPMIKEYLKDVIILRKDPLQKPEELSPSEKEIRKLCYSYGNKSSHEQLAIVKKLTTEGQYEVMASVMAKKGNYATFEWAFRNEDTAIANWTSYLCDHQIHVSGEVDMIKTLELFHEFRSLHKVCPRTIALFDREGLLEKYKEELHLRKFLEKEIAKNEHDQSIIAILQVLPDFVPETRYLRSLIVAMDYDYDDHVSFRERASFYGYYDDPDGETIMRLKPQYRKFFVELIAKLPEHEQPKLDWFISSTD
jgi:hypothetical protein